MDFGSRGGEWEGGDTQELQEWDWNAEDPLCGTAARQECSHGKTPDSHPRLPTPQLLGKILDPLEPLGHSNIPGGAPSSLGNSPAPSPRSGKASGSRVLPGERNLGLNRRLYLHIFIVL